MRKGILQITCPPLKIRKQCKRQPPLQIQGVSLLRIPCRVLERAHILDCGGNWNNVNGTWRIFLSLILTLLTLHCILLGKFPQVKGKQGALFTAGALTRGSESVCRKGGEEEKQKAKLMVSTVDYVVKQMGNRERNTEGRLGPGGRQGGKIPRINCTCYCHCDC